MQLLFQGHGEATGCVLLSSPKLYDVSKCHFQTGVWASSPALEGSDTASSELFFFLFALEFFTVPKQEEVG